ncbi:hypothetical protein H5410_005524 [Solanum commersonii]|uniref:DUF4283 domain-containing protein n=1 Tax=Solanum commersonii TaxID=4109 RepID=A0A9J6A7K4_SOLCO|nr:hypothetical protein H5410_005524 [Solanum commersonii]
MSHCQSDLNTPTSPDGADMAIDQTTAEEKQSFKNILITRAPIQSKNPIEAKERSNTLLEELMTGTGEDTQMDYLSEGNNRVSLTEEEKKRIYQPWSPILKKKLSLMWRVSEEIVLIDLGHDYFIVKFLKEENLHKSLQHGPWFINGYFLSVRLAKLPTEFYNHTILAKVGLKLRKLVKTNVCTSATLRGRYARICVEILLDTPVHKYV